MVRGGLSTSYFDRDLEKVKAQDLQIAGAFQEVGALRTKVLLGCSKDIKSRVAGEESVRGTVRDDRGVQLMEEHVIHGKDL